jgi:uncharacterized protein (TIGR04552 family)
MLLAPYSQADTIAIRLALTGDSVVDFHGGWFYEQDKLIHFLHLNGLEWPNTSDMLYLENLYRSAVSYLTDTQNYRIPAALKNLTFILDLFYISSQKSTSRTAKFACMILKVMHVLHHLNGRQLLLHSALPEKKLFSLLHNKIFSIFDEMRQAGINAVEFTSSHKSLHSMTTKLLMKRSNLATHIFDRLRFRIILETKEDVLNTIIYLFRHLIPCNYVLPEQSHNNILTSMYIQDCLKSINPNISHYIQGIDKNKEPSNQFSDKSYRCVHFVTDLPFRIDEDLMHNLEDLDSDELWYKIPIVFLQTEVQLFDREAAKHNENGSASHTVYKRRQYQSVRRRLEGGAFGL